MLVIGEKINGTRSEVAKAIQARDAGMIRALAKSQVAAGAGYLDVNAGTHPNQEPEDMIWLIETIQEAVDVPLCLDSANPKALEAGLKKVAKPAMINSLSGEKKRIEGVLPLACQYKTKLVVLALDDHGIPATAADRVAIVDSLIALTRKGGLPDENLYVDPLVITIATDNNSGLTAFETIRTVKAKYPEVHFTCGLSNISFGQPSRTLINQAFAVLAIQAGLDSAIIDPEEKGLRNIVHAAEMVLALDPHCKRYNQAHRAGLIGAQAPAQVTAAPQAESSLVAAMKNLVGAMAQSGILDGANLAAVSQPCAAAEARDDTEPVMDEASDDKARVKEMIAAMVDMDEEKVAEMTTAWLDEGKDPMVLLDVSREAMVEVGRLFDLKEYFVPELILAGEILGDISNAVKPYLKGDSGDAGEKKGRVLLGTVEGDIHDIGKDIVGTMMDINGYEVMDLGVDVPAAKFVEAAQSFKPQVVALSGFLTLAYDPMKETIAAVKEVMQDDGVRYMIGGGQMDDEVAKYVGADAFGKDAMEAVKLCDKWIMGGNA